MDERVKERRRSVRRERGRRRAGLIVACVAVVGALALFMWLRSSDVFAVERVTTTPVTHVTVEQIASATADARGASLLALSVGPIEETLAGLPYVRSARVLRRFPHTLEVRVVEHTPVAQLQAKDGSTWLLSEDGRVLEKKRNGALPLFVPEGGWEPVAGEYSPAWLAEALPLAGMLAAFSEEAALPAVVQARVARTGEVVLDLKEGMEIRLGEPAELKHKLTVASTIIQRYLKDGKRIRYVDASVPDRVAVKAE
jgi:cell division protein FtsQ